MQKTYVIYFLDKYHYVTNMREITIIENTKSHIKNYTQLLDFDFKI